MATSAPKRKRMTQGESCVIMDDGVNENCITTEIKRGRLSKYADARGNPTSSIEIMEVDNDENERESEGEEQKPNLQALINDLQRILLAMEENPNGVSNTICEVETDARTLPVVGWRDLLLRADLVQSMWDNLSGRSKELPELDPVDGSSISAKMTLLERRVGDAIYKAQELARVLKNKSGEKEDDPISRLFGVATTSTHTPGTLQSTFTVTKVTTSPSRNLNSSLEIADGLKINSEVEHGEVEEDQNIRLLYGTPAKNVPTAKPARAPKAPDSVQDLQSAQREQMEEAIAQMATQMKIKTANLHNTIRQQNTGLLHDMEAVAEENVAAVASLAKQTNEQVRKSWSQTTSTWVTLFVIGGMFVLALVTIFMIPKEPNACLFFCPPKYFTNTVSTKNKKQQHPAQNKIVEGFNEDWPSAYMEIEKELTEHQLPKASSGGTQEEQIQIGINGNNDIDAGSDIVSVNGFEASASDYDSVDTNESILEELGIDSVHMDQENDSEREMEFKKHAATIEDDVNEQDRNEGNKHNDVVGTSVDNASDEAEMIIDEVEQQFEDEDDSELPYVEFGSFTPFDLSFAAATGKVKLLRAYLLQKKGWMNHQDENGWGPIHEAAALGRTKSVSILIGEGCLVSLQTASGHTALDLALQRLPHDHPTVQLLLEAMGYSSVSKYVNCEMGSDGTCLTTGSMLKDPDSTSTADTALPDLMKIPSRESILAEFEETRNDDTTNVVSFGRSADMDSGKKNSNANNGNNNHDNDHINKNTGYVPTYNGTPFYASDVRRASMIRGGNGSETSSLLDGYLRVLSVHNNGNMIESYVNEPDHNGWTALHLAVNSGIYENVKLLLDSGADINIITSTKHTALEIAYHKYGGDHPVTQLLEDYEYDAATQEYY